MLNSTLGYLIDILILFLYMEVCDSIFILRLTQKLCTSKMCEDLFLRREKNAINKKLLRSDII